MLLFILPTCFFYIYLYRNITIVVFESSILFSTRFQNAQLKYHASPLNCPTLGKKTRPVRRLHRQNRQSSKVGQKKPTQQVRFSRLLNRLLPLWHGSGPQLTLQVCFTPLHFCVFGSTFSPLDIFPPPPIRVGCFGSV